MSYLRGAAARAIALQEIQNCASEWRRLYRNAQLHEFPYTEDESEIFWDHLSSSVPFLIDDLQENIKEEFGCKVRIVTVTGGGKTWMPVLNEKMQAYEFKRKFDPDWVFRLETLETWCYFDSNCEIYEETWPEPDEVELWVSDWTAAADEFSTCAKVLKKVNDTARSEAAGVAAWWKEEREALMEIRVLSESEEETEEEYETECN